MLAKHIQRGFLLTGFGFGLFGVGMGIVMAASQNHNHQVAHAHALLLGFVVSVLYALIDKAWLKKEEVSGLAQAQYYLHIIGSLLLIISLFLLYTSWIAKALLIPLLAVSSLMVFAAMATMAWLVWRALTCEQH